MKAEDIRNSKMLETELLREITAQLAEHNEIARQRLTIEREDFELRNDPLKMIERMKQVAPAFGSIMGTAMAAADQAKVADAAVPSKRHRNH